MDRNACRKSLAVTLKDYLIAMEVIKSETPTIDIRKLINRNISLIRVQISAVKRFARNIGLIDYAENYDMSTEQLIAKIESEENENENRT